MEFINKTFSLTQVVLYYFLYNVTTCTTCTTCTLFVIGFHRINVSHLNQTALPMRRKPANQTQLLDKGASSCCTLTPPASVLHVWQSCNLATALWWPIDRQAEKLFLSSSPRVCFVNPLPICLEHNSVDNEILRL